jgi:uncharacterized protein
VIFVDSSFWIADFLPRDRRHAEALECSRATSSRPLVTSALVLGETWTFLRRRVGHALSTTWLEAVVGRMTLRVEHIAPELEAEAWRWLRVRDECPYSFVDATSFALMRKLRINEALAFDGGFAAAGFVELKP